MSATASSRRIAEWARSWNAGLTRFLRRRLPQQIDAEDLAQEVYVRLLRVEKLELIEEPQAYLYKVAVNVAAEWRMRACNSKPHTADELDALVAATTPETVLSEAEFARVATDEPVEVYYSLGNPAPAAGVALAPLDRRGDYWDFGRLDKRLLGR